MAAVTEQTNVAGTQALLQEAWNSRVEHFTQVSSSGVLCHHQRPITEHDFPSIVSAREPYRHSKWVSEKIALEWAQRGLPVSIASPTCPIGAEDETPTPTGRIILDFLQGRFPFAAPTILNFVDVADLADGIVAVAERGRTGERYILGEHNLWHAEFLQLLTRLTGLPSPRRTLPWWIVAIAGVFGEMTGNDRVCWETAAHCRKHQPFDTTKARTELNWIPKTSLADSAQAAVNWQQNRQPVRQDAQSEIPALGRNQLDPVKSLQ